MLGRQQNDAFDKVWGDWGKVSQEKADFPDLSESGNRVLDQAPSSVM